MVTESDLFSSASYFHGIEVWLCSITMGGSGGPNFERHRCNFTHLVHFAVFRLKIICGFHSFSFKPKKICNHWLLYHPGWLEKSSLIFLSLLWRKTQDRHWQPFVLGLENNKATNRTNHIPVVQNVFVSLFYIMFNVLLLLEGNKSWNNFNFHGSRAKRRHLLMVTNRTLSKETFVSYYINRDSAGAENKLDRTILGTRCMWVIFLLCSDVEWMKTFQ